MPLLYENKSDTEIQLMKDWAEVRQYVEKHFENKPDIQVCLFLIGVNEFGQIREFEKEEKQDLMHVGMCTLLLDEYYEYDYTDVDGWPHFKELKPMEAMFIKIQETFLKKKIVQYFKEKVY
jgi:hypothetical protein